MIANSYKNPSLKNYENNSEQRHQEQQDATFIRRRDHKTGQDMGNQREKKEKRESSISHYRNSQISDAKQNSCVHFFQILFVHDIYHFNQIQVLFQMTHEKPQIQQKQTQTNSNSNLQTIKGLDSQIKIAELENIYHPRVNEELHRIHIQPKPTQTNQITQNPIYCFWGGVSNANSRVY